jgi:hypothetical protein
VIPAILVGAGIGLNALGNFMASKQRAKRLRENAQRARWMASDSLARGEQGAGKVAAATENRIAHQQVAYGAAGVDAASGSAVKVISQTAMVGKLDEETVRNNAYRAAWGYEMSARDMEQQAADEDAARPFNLFGSIFGGAGRVAEMGVNYQGAGDYGGESAAAHPSWESVPESDYGAGD